MTPELVPCSDVSKQATDTREKIRGETYRARGVKDLDGEELSLLGYTVGLGSNGSSAVSTVTVTISVGAIASVIGKEGSTTLELGVSGGDTSVNNVHTGVCSSTAVVGVRSATTGLVGDTRQTPGGRGLSDVCLLLEMLNFAKVGLDNSILLNVVNTREVAQELHDVVAHLRGETTKVAELVDVGRVLLEKLQSTLDERLQVLVLHLDDVLSRNGSTSARLKDRSWESKSHSRQKREEESELHDGVC